MFSSLLLWIDICIFTTPLNIILVGFQGSGYKYVSPTCHLYSSWLALYSSILMRILMNSFQCSYEDYMRWYFRSNNKWIWHFIIGTQSILLPLPFQRASTIISSVLLFPPDSSIHSHFTDRDTEGQRDAYELSKDIQSINVRETQICPFLYKNSIPYWIEPPYIKMVIFFFEKLGLSFPLMRK